VSVAEPLIIEQRSGFTLATIMARKATPMDRLETALGLALPVTPSAKSGKGMTLVATGPGTWLAMGDGSGETTPAALSQRLAGLASVVDQSSGYAIFRLSGRGARTLLQRGAPVDLHPSAFSPGSAAVTLIAHIGVLIWQADHLPTYEVAIFRSLAASFGAWLEAGVAAL